jgi:hypothetical protein
MTAAAEAYSLEWFDLRKRALLKLKQARNGRGNVKPGLSQRSCYGTCSCSRATFLGRQLSACQQYHTVPKHFLVKKCHLCFNIIKGLEQTP